MIERSDTDVWRIPLGWGWAIGLCPHCHGLHVGITRYRTGGWSFALLWLHFGRKADRENWTHHFS